MPDFGLRVLNASTDIQIDSTYRNYSFIKTGRSYTDFSGNYPYLVATFPTQAIPPIFTIFPPRTGFCSVQGVTATHAILQPFTTGSNFLIRYQVWQRGVVTSATWGINVNNASGNTVFSSEDSHFTIEGVATLTATLSNSLSKNPIVGGVAVTTGKPDSYALYAPTAAIERRAVPPTGEGWIIERAIGWGEQYITPVVASDFWYLGRTFENYPAAGNTVFLGATTLTSVGTVSLVSVRNTASGPFQKWSNVYRTKGANTNYPLTDFVRIGSYLIEGTTGSALTLKIKHRGRDALLTKNELLGTAAGQIDVIGNITASSLLSATRVLVQRTGFSWDETYRSTDAGGTWSTIATNARSIKPHIWLSASALLGFGASGFYKSTDYGKTFSLVSSIPGAAFGIVDMAYLPGTSAMLAWDTQRIWKTYDQGSSWTASVINVNKPNAVTKDPAVIRSVKWVGGLTVLVGIGQTGAGIRRAKILKSTDGGNNWTEATNFSGTWNYHPLGLGTPKSVMSVTCNTASSNIVAALTGSVTQIWRSQDQGNSWEFIDELSYGFKKSRLDNPNMTIGMDVIATNTIFLRSNSPNVPIDTRNYLWKNYDGTPELWD